MTDAVDAHEHITPPSISHFVTDFQHTSSRF
jgi:hypothetical protein